MVYCYNCGETVMKKAKFCVFCKADFSKYEEENEEENVEQQEQQNVEQNVEDEDENQAKEIVKKIIQKQIKKKTISAKQKSHLDKLHNLRKNSKGVFMKKEEIEEPEVVKQPKAKAVVKPRAPVVKQVVQRVQRAPKEQTPQPPFNPYFNLM